MKNISIFEELSIYSHTLHAFTTEPTEGISERKHVPQGAKEMVRGSKQVDMNIRQQYFFPITEK